MSRSTALTSRRDDPRHPQGRVAPGEDPLGPLSTGHVGVNVRDLDRSVRFYRALFGFVSKGRSEVEGRRYEFLGTDTQLVLTLWQQAEAPYDPRAAGLHHLSFQVPSLEHVREAERRVRRLGAPLHHGGAVAHGEGAASGGIYFDDPDGIRLEVFTADGLHAAPAPSGEAPTCGFF